MDRFVELQVFVAVAEESGFAPAAKRLGMSPPAVTRAVANLEKRLGLQLFNRTTRYVRPTSAGERYLSHVREILLGLEEADSAVLGTHVTPVGSLAITAPVLFGKKYVVPGVVDFLEQFPGASVSFALLDRVVNLLEEGFDMGVRIGDLPDSSMRAIPVGSVSWMVCTSPNYLDEHPEPRSYTELADHPVVSVSESTTHNSWTFLDQNKTKSVTLNSRLSVTNPDAAINAAKLGYGFARVLSYQITDALQEGSLVRVLGHYEPAPLPVHVIHREERGGSALTRAIIDFMVDHLRNQVGLR